MRLFDATILYFTEDYMKQSYKETIPDEDKERFHIAAFPAELTRLMYQADVVFYRTPKGKLHVVKDRPGYLLRHNMEINEQNLKNKNFTKI